jgi:PIN domain nuclease of toxin-antitoxin system
MPRSNLLLDTHIVLWWRANDRRLGAEARGAIATADAVFVSVASAWEVAIKIRLGRLRIPESFAKGVESSGFERLSITFEHAEAAGVLPQHHTDPFDRMLIAQAMSEDLTLVSADRVFAKYGVRLLGVPP